MVVIKFPDKGSLRRAATQKKRNGSCQHQANPSRNEILLLRLADTIDNEILDGILEHDLAVHEVAAILIHRVAHLIRAMPSLPSSEHVHADELVKYLCSLLVRETEDPERELKKPS